MWPFIWTNLNPIHPRILCAKFGWNWPCGSGEEDENVKSLQTDRQMDGQTDDGRQVIRKAHLSFQLRWGKKPMSLLLFELSDILYMHNSYCNKQGAHGPHCSPEKHWRRRFKFVNVFLLFCNYLPLERMWLFIWTYLNSLFPRMLCAKFGWNGLSGSGKENF